MDGKIITAYDYKDESGVLLYQNVRFEPKDFRQRRSDGKGGWVWNLNGVRRVLYRLPELLAPTISRNEWVFFCEGEKSRFARSGVAVYKKELLLTGVAGRTIPCR